jgi:pimeloyl-ACP methyl ester carboxylesterase
MPFRIKITLTILAAVFIALLLVPFVLPIAPLKDTVSERELADEDSRFVRVGDLDVHYKAHGEGERVALLLHGFGSSVFTWEEVLDALPEEWRVIAFDRPGFGLTSRPLAWQGDNPYAPEAQRRLLLDLMDELGLSEAVLVGNSAGGTLAVEFALEHPERVSSLILVSPAIYEGGGAPGWARPLLNLPQMDRLGPLIMRQFGGDPGEAFLRAAYDDESRLTPERLAGHRRALRAHDWDKALWELTKASRAPAVAGRLSELQLPVLVVSGKEDAIVSPELSTRLARELPNAQLVLLAGCGHLPQEECPQAFVRALEPFLAELSAAAP